MLQKTIDKLERKKRATWSGYYQRITPTKKEKIIRAEKKYRSTKDYAYKID